MKNNIIIITLLGLFLVSSCKKDDLLDPVPFISIVDISPKSVVQFTDPVIITLEYEDQDGDLGFDSPDSMSVFVQDSRLAEPDLYHIPPLSPPDTTLHIRGQINVEISSPFLLGNGSSETVNFTVQLKDRAGNLSNAVVSEDIVITR